jgi:hypothetical protein
MSESTVEIIVDNETQGADTSVKSAIDAPTEQIVEIVPGDEVDPEKQEIVPPPIPKGVQKRIDRAVREKYEAQARTKMLEERLNAIESRQPNVVEQRSDDEPSIEQYDNFDKFVAAKAAYIAKKQIESTLTEREQRQRAASEAAERTKTVDSWNKRMAAATAEMPDFEEVVSSSDVPMTDAMQQAIMESDFGPKLAYYLANNPDEAAAIGKLSPIGSIRALGRIEERLAGQVPAYKACRRTRYGQKRPWSNVRC